MIVTVLTWSALVAGLVPMSWFLVWFRPSWPIKSPAFLIAGLVWAVWLGYARVGVVLAIRGWVPRFAGWADGVASVAPLLVIDAMVIGLLGWFLPYRIAWRLAMESSFAKEVKDE